MSSIVIIEEDQLMRGLLVEWLSAEGYSVRAAAPGSTQAANKVDLVIVDVVMPRYEGAKTLRAVKAAYPETPLIAISGDNSGRDSSTLRGGRRTRRSPGDRQPIHAIRSARSSQGRDRMAGVLNGT